MYPAAPSPDTDGGRSTASRSPQVVVRAGKTFLCTACGTLVQVPDDVVGQLVYAVEPAEPDPPPQPPITQQTPPKEPASQAEYEPAKPRPAATAARKPEPVSRSVDTRAARVSPQKRPTQPRSPQRPPRPLFTGQTIEGLRVPSAGQMDRAFHWIAFHLKVLDRQDGQLKRLRKLLKQGSKNRRPRHGPGRPAPRGPTVSSEAGAEDIAPTPAEKRHGTPMPAYTQADPGAAPQADNEHPRGPP